MDSSQPNVSVGLSELISGSYQHQPPPGSSTDTHTAPPPKLSLMVQPPTSPPSGDNGAIHRNLPSHSSSGSSGAKKQSLLDLPHTDILGPAEVIKKLLTLPYTQGNDYFALHRLGNTLVLDSMEGGDQFESDPSCPTKQKEGVPRIAARRTHPDTLSTATPASASPSQESVLDKLHHLEHLDIDSEAACSSSFTSASAPSAPPSSISNMYSNSLGSTFLPPPEYYLPEESASAAQPFRQVLRWQVGTYACSYAYSYSPTGRETDIHAYSERDRE